MFENIVDSLKELHRDTASFSELTENRKRMDETIENITSPLLIMVMGEFSTGKSSFINALVEKEVTIVNARPTTAVITKLCYGLEDRITVFFQDGTQKNYSVEDFEALTVESEETIELRKNIDFVERALPLEMLKSMTIIDSPGLNSLNQSHEETTRRFMDKSDTVIWLFDAHDPCKQTEIDAMKRLNPRLSPLVLVNKMDLLDEDDGDSPEKILSDIGRKLRNNRLEVQDIIGISAKMAFQGKQKNNEKILSESNIGEFYNRLETVILPHREEYKRNAMFDNLAKLIFDVGTVLAYKKRDNYKQKDTDYAAYIEGEETLALATDALENVIDLFLDFFDLSRNDFSDNQVNKMKLNPSERTVFGVLYWLGLAVEKNTEISKKHLEAAAVRNDNVAQTIMADVCNELGQESKAKYWRARLGIKEISEEGKKKQESSIHVNDSSTIFNSQCISGKLGYGIHLISNIPEKLAIAKEKTDNKKFRIAVIGVFGTGKTSFINAFLGSELLPVSIFPTTRINCKVVYGNHTVYKIFNHNRDFKIVSEKDFRKIVSENDFPLDKEFDYAEISYPSAFIENNMEIVDTVAINCNLQSTIDAINCADAIVMVLSVCNINILTNSEYGFVISLPNEIKNKILFVINHLDLLDEEKDDPYELLAEVKLKLSDIVPSDFSFDNRIFLVSSKDALNQRSENTGILGVENELKRMYLSKIKTERHI